MIMALIYRNVPRKKANELLLLGERWTPARRWRRASSTRSCPTSELDAAVADWAGRLASKSPVIMRLGKEAMRRQLDMPLDDALDYLRAQLSLALSTEDIVEGVTAFFEKREPVGKDADGDDAETPSPRPRARSVARRASKPRRRARSSLLRPLVEDLQERRARIRIGGGEEKIAAQHASEKLTARERIALLIDERHLRRAGHPRAPALLPARDGRRGRARRRRDHRLRQDRRPPDGRVRVRLHGDGRLDGHDRRAEGHAPARAGADASGSRSCGCSTPPARACRRRRARCSRAPGTCSARRS